MKKEINELKKNSNNSDNVSAKATVTKSKLKNEVSTERKLSEAKLTDKNVDEVETNIKSVDISTLEKDKNVEKTIGNLMVLVLVFVAVGLLILFMPKIYEKMKNYDVPEVEGFVPEKEEKELEKITLESKIVKNLIYPIMRIDNNDTFTYYSLSSMSLSDMSNNDILVNAFLEIYEGNTTHYEGYVNGNCLGYDNQRQFKQSYINSSIESILGKNLEYDYDDFYVPVSTGSKYSGNWSYDSENKIFIYKGTCDKVKSISYYDLKVPVKVNASDNNKTLEIYFYVGFAKVENNNYVIYSDVNLTKEIKSGSINNTNELESIFKDLVSSKPVNMYKYTYKKDLCTYGGYCMEKGEWVNG